MRFSEAFFVKESRKWCDFLFWLFFSYLCYPCQFRLHYFSTSCAGNVSVSRAIVCYSLPSTGITPLHRYYSIIRLPRAIRFLTLLSLVTRTPDSLWGATRISCVTVKYQCIACWFLRPRGSCGFLTITLTAVLLSGLTTTSAFPFSVFRSSINSVFWLLAYYLVRLRLKKWVTPLPPRLTTGGWSTLPDGIPTHYILRPCTSALSGTGFLQAPGSFHPMHPMNLLVQDHVKGRHPFPFYDKVIISVNLRSGNPVSFRTVYASANIQGFLIIVSIVHSGLMSNYWRKERCLEPARNGEW